MGDSLVVWNFVNKQLYELRRQERLAQAWTPRLNCPRCHNSLVTCFCKQIRPFRSNPEFAILIHKEETKRSVATGRMSHLCIENSHLFEGNEFGENVAVNALLNDSTRFPVVLYPSRDAKNLSPMRLEERRELFPSNKKLLIFILDGTWAEARRLLRRSPNLHRLPFVCFSPPTPSGFHVRKQPRAYCYSTIESIHHLIELVSGRKGGAHDNLLEVFSGMVQQQLAFGHRGLPRRRG